MICLIVACSRFLPTPICLLSTRRYWKWLRRRFRLRDCLSWSWLSCCNGCGNNTDRSKGVHQNRKCESQKGFGKNFINISPSCSLIACTYVSHSSRLCLKAFLGKQDQKFVIGRQQDAQECLTVLLDAFFSKVSMHGLLCWLIFVSIN